MANTRTLVPDLDGPVPLQTSRVAPDPYSRPRADPNAGSSLAELAGALGKLRPDIAAFTAPIMQDYVETETATGQRYREQMKAGAVAAGDFAAEKKKWSPYRLQGFEMADAQLAAGDYMHELSQSLDTLSNDENTSPETLKSKVEEVRAKYLQRGTGSGAIWQKTFEQYRQGYENGALSAFSEKLSAARERTAVLNITQHYAEELTTLAGSVDPETAVNDWKSLYADPSFLNSPLSPTQQAQAMANGFRIASSHAVTSGRFDQADALLSMMRNIETKDGAKLATTLYGSEAMDAMAHEIHAAKITANETEGDRRRQEVQQLSLDLRANLKALTGTPSSQWPSSPPPELLDRAAKYGMDEDVARKWDYFRLRDTGDTKRDDAADLQAARSTLADLNLSLLANKNEANFGDIYHRALELTKAPEFQGAEAKESLVGFLSNLDRFADSFGDIGKAAAPNVHTGAAEFRTAMTNELSALNRTFLDIQRNNQIDADDVIGKALRKLGDKVTLAQDDAGARYFDANDLRTEMSEAYATGLERLRGGRPWRDVRQTELDTLRNTIINDYRPRILQRIKDAQDALKAASGPTPAQTAAGLRAPAGTIGIDGLPTWAAAKSLLESRYVYDEYPSKGQREAITATGGGYIALSKFNAADPVKSNLEAVTSRGVPTDVLRRRDRSFDPAVSQFQQLWQDTTSELQYIEKTHRDLLRNSSTAGLPGNWASNMSITNTADPDAINRNIVLRWANLRYHIRKLADVRGVTPEELQHLPQTWFTDERTPYPVVPVFLNENELTNEALGEVQARYHLTSLQVKDFVATQMKLMQIRNRASKGFSPLDSRVSYPHATLGETGLAPAEPVLDLAKTRAMLEAQAKGMPATP
jgi:hypothetical protein